MTNTNITAPAILFDVPQIEELPQILSDHIFVELEVLNGEISQEEVEQYEMDVEAYEEQLEKGEIMGFVPKDLVKPIKPKHTKKYSKININLTDKIITFWSVNWDKTNDHEVIVVEYFQRESGKEEQIIIKASKKQWMDILQQFGAIHTKLQPIAPY